MDREKAFQRKLNQFQEFPHFPKAYLLNVQLVWDHEGENQSSHKLSKPSSYTGHRTSTPAFCWRANVTGHPTIKDLNYFKITNFKHWRVAVPGIDYHLRPRLLFWWLKRGQIILPSPYFTYWSLQLITEMSKVIVGNLAFPNLTLF